MTKLTLELSSQDALFLLEELQRHIGAREHELVHTDAPALQHAVAGDVARLKGIYGRMEEAVGREFAPAPGP